MTRAISALLMLCLVAGPLGVAMAVLAWQAAASSSTTATSAGPADRSGEQAIAGQFAEQVVMTWLGTTSDHPEALLALVPGATVPAGVSEAFQATDPAVADIREIDGTWSVTVAATVTDARKIRARRFYRVPVSVAGTGAVTALTLPTLVTGPTPTRPAGDAYRTEVAPGTPVGVAVADFLRAYLTGADVSRYLTPGVLITIPAPAPFTSIHVDDLRTVTDDLDPAAVPRDGQRLRLMSAVTASVSAEQAAAVAFALTLTARADRWEITAIDPVPVSPPPGDPSPAAS